MGESEMRVRGNGRLEFLFPLSKRARPPSRKWLLFLRLITIALLASFGSLAVEQRLSAAGELQHVSVFANSQTSESVGNGEHYSDPPSGLEDEEREPLVEKDITALGSSPSIEPRPVRLALSSFFRAIILLDERSGVLGELDRPPASASAHGSV